MNCFFQSMLILNFIFILHKTLGNLILEMVKKIAEYKICNVEYTWPKQTKRSHSAAQYLDFFSWSKVSLIWVMDLLIISAAHSTCLFNQWLLFSSKWDVSCRQMRFNMNMQQQINTWKNAKQGASFCTKSNLSALINLKIYHVSF